MKTVNIAPGILVTSETDNGPDALFEFGKDEFIPFFANVTLVRRGNNGEKEDMVLLGSEDVDVEVDGKLKTAAALIFCEADKLWDLDDDDVSVLCSDIEYLEKKQAL